MAGCACALWLKYRILHPSLAAASHTARVLYPSLNMHPQRLDGIVILDTQHVDVRQSHQQLTNADRVRFHRSSPI